MKLDIQTLAGKKSGSVDLDKAVFGQEPRKDILHRMVRYQLASVLVVKRAAVQRVMVTVLCHNSAAGQKLMARGLGHMHTICRRRFALWRFVTHFQRRLARKS